MTPKEALDRFLLKRFARDWDDEKIGAFSKKISAEQKPLLPEAAQRTFENIDTKSASLLTHVSMMVAAIGITATFVAESKWEQAFMVFQIMLYLLIAIACLRCSSLFRGAMDENLSPMEIGREVVLRREVYSFCNAASIYLTVLVLVMLPILLYF